MFEYYKAIVDLADAQKYFSTIPDVSNGLPNCAIQDLANAHLA